MCCREPATSSTSKRYCFFFFWVVLTPNKLVECEGSLNWVHVSHPDWLEFGKEMVDG
jgi:hypothetical protein